MRICARLILFAACVIPVFAAVSADARRGAEFFEKQKCNTCHSAGAAMKGGTQAPDLALRADRDYTPAGIASRMWNHAPAMWAKISEAGMSVPAVSEQDAADLFAFFYSARYFEKPGDAARGKRAFTEKHCAECHDLSGESGKPGPAVAKWQSLRDPIALVQRMWNHLPQMKSETEKRKVSWPELTTQDLTDMLVYLQNSPQLRGSSSTAFAMTTGSNGEQIFQAKGCANCHKGAMALDKRLSNQTLTGIAVDMWNHGPRMKEPGITLSEDEMRQLLSYVWGSQFFVSHGSAARGKRVFDSKQCATCHGQGIAPQIEGNAQFSDITLVSALWKHGPQMLSQLKQKSMAWPQFTPAQMSDLIAYLAAPGGH
jgi:mono/diheme cytochrome c family protein